MAFISRNTFYKLTFLLTSTSSSSSRSINSTRNLSFKILQNIPVVSVQQSSSSSRSLSIFSSTGPLSNNYNIKTFKSTPAAEESNKTTTIGMKNHEMDHQHQDKKLKMDDDNTTTTLDVNVGVKVEDKILSPPVNKGMTQLDKEAFTKELQVPMIYIPTSFDPRQIGDIMSKVKKYIIRLAKFKSIIDPELHELDKFTKKIVFNPDIVKEQELKGLLENLKIPQEIIDTVGSTWITITYDNWRLEHLINSIFPDDDQDKPSGFAQIGHIAHVNLRDHQLPYKNIIGQFILDKTPQTQTVVHKLNIIGESLYRNFQLDVIAGVPNFIVKLKENYCTYEMDFSQVYWNSKLSTEHERITKDWLKPDDILYDVMAGVGPFAIPGGKKKCFVLANDLNPESYKWLKHNVQLNKVTKFVQVFNKDGHQFIKEDIPRDIKERSSNFVQDRDPNEVNYNQFDLDKNKFHVTMNLPGMAVEFLPSFWNILPGFNLDPRFKMIVHVYCFIKDISGYREKAIGLVEHHLGFKFGPEHLLEVLFVRDVAPTKEMWRVSFNMPREILTGEIEKSITSTNSNEPKIEDSSKSKACNLKQDESTV